MSGQGITEARVREIVREEIGKLASNTASERLAELQIEELLYQRRLRQSAQDVAFRLSMPRSGG